MGFFKLEKNDTRLPNLVIIGAMKCGTTSLHYYLNLHPEIRMTREKELNFFIKERNWDRGIDWYRAHFRGSEKIHGESSPNYTNYPVWGGVPERMHSVIPDAKLIYILRDPIERIISHYIHEYSEGRESRPINEALKEFNSSYIYRSRYYMQLEQFLQFFPASNILIITQENLYRNRLQTLKEVFKFLNVDDSFYSPRFFKLKHRSSDRRRKNRVGMFLYRLYRETVAERLPPPIRWHMGQLLCFPFSSKIKRPVLDNALREEIADHLRDYINRLREFTGYSFKEWSV